jgi:predicted RNA binding protein YcfA (HicA-like mRNA interferase family)
MNAREVIKRLKADAWYVLKRKGSSHVQLKHPAKPGKVTVSDHKGKDIPRETLDSIEKIGRKAEACGHDPLRLSGGRRQRV